MISDGTAFLYHELLKCVLNWPKCSPEYKQLALSGNIVLPDGTKPAGVRIATIDEWNQIKAVYLK